MDALHYAARDLLQYVDKPRSLIRVSDRTWVSVAGNCTASPVFIPALPRLDGAGRSGRTVCAGEASQPSVWGNLHWPWLCLLAVHLGTAVLLERYMQCPEYGRQLSLLGPGYHARVGRCDRRTGRLAALETGQGGWGGRGGMYPFITTCLCALLLPHARPSTFCVQFSLSPEPI